MWTPSSAHLHHTSACLLSLLIIWEEEHMQSTDLKEIKAALWEQAYHPCTRVKRGTAQVMAIRRSKGQLLAQLRGMNRWHLVEAMTGDQTQALPNRRLRPRRRHRSSVQSLPGEMSNGARCPWEIPAKRANQEKFCPSACATLFL